MTTKLKILITDDDYGDRKLIKRALMSSGLPCEFTETESIDQALAACDQSAFDCALIDYRLPGDDGLAGVTVLHERRPFMAIVMSTGQGDEMIATEAMKRGASDYIPKASIQAESIRRCIENAVEKVDLRRKVNQQREELEHFNRVLVHDVKQPLRSVRLFTGLIEQNIKRGQIEHVADHCRIVMGVVERAEALIDTLQQYTEASEQVVFERVNMSCVLADTLTNLEHIVQARGAVITSDQLPFVSGNAPQLMQLLQNLITNAINYCAAETPSVHVSSQSTANHSWLFGVKDNGIGIQEQHRHMVFEPFKRGEGAGQTEGTGLGLATCKKVVERHHGKIWCESEAGKGATFFFTLQKAAES